MPRPLYLCAAGGRFRFTLKATNETGSDLPSLLLAIAIAPTENQDWSNSKPDLEIKSGQGYEPVDLQWDAPGGRFWIGGGYDAVNFPKGSTITVDFTLAFPANTALGGGAELDVVSDLSRPDDSAPLGDSVAGFTVIAGSAKPGGGSTTSTSTPATKPVSITSSAPHPTTTYTAAAAGGLAGTGSGSVPTLAIVGGAVIVVGAGLVLYTRRRIHGSHQA